MRHRVAPALVLALLASCGGSSGKNAADGSTPSDGSTHPVGDAGRVAGPSLGDFEITYYWLVLESDYGGADTTSLVNPSCNPVATVPAAFADDVCVEGSGRLSSGQVINYADDCGCGYACSNGATVCFQGLDASAFPWGAGSRDNALVPLRSLAVDEGEIAHGTVVYLPAFDGLSIPSIDGLGGFVHDGCFRADDTGNGIDGKHVDVFAGSTSMFEELESRFDSVTSHLAIHVGAPHCAYLAP